MLLLVARCRLADGDQDGARQAVRDRADRSAATNPPPAAARRAGRRARRPGRRCRRRGAPRRARDVVDLVGSTRSVAQRGHHRLGGRRHAAARVRADDSRGPTPSAGAPHAEWSGGRSGRSVVVRGLPAQAPRRSLDRPALCQPGGCARWPTTRRRWGRSNCMRTRSPTGSCSRDRGPSRRPGPPSARAGRTFIEAARGMISLLHAVPPDDEVLADLLSELRSTVEEIRLLTQQRRLDPSSGPPPPGARAADPIAHPNGGGGSGAATELLLGEAVGALGDRQLVEYANLDGNCGRSPAIVDGVRCTSSGSIDEIEVEVDQIELRAEPSEPGPRVARVRRGPHPRRSDMSAERRPSSSCPTAFDRPNAHS